MKGLGAHQAAERLLRDGPNLLPGKQQHSLWLMVREMLHEPMFLLLFVAALLYFLLGDLREALALSVAVVGTVGLTLYQEIKTEKAIDALRDLTSPRALVIRDSVAQRIAGSDVVVGDLLLLREGDRIAADAALLSTSDLQVDESLLTGESIAVHKVALAPEQQTENGIVNCAMPRPGGDNLAFVYSGTLVIRGQGTACVMATGARTEIGRIGFSLQTLEVEKSPLQRQTSQLVRTLAWLTLGLSLLLVLIYGVMRGNWMEALLAGIAFAMSLIPEEFPVILLIFPALGAWRLSRQQVLTRRVSAIETLGAISVLCADKTGTMTENRMAVSQLYVDGKTVNIDYSAATASGMPEEFHSLVEFAILASEIDPVDPMEKAFGDLGQHVLPDTGRRHHSWQLVHKYGLTPELRAMTHVWKPVTDENLPVADYIVATKGAPEMIVDLCRLDEADKHRIFAQVNAMAAQGLRVLAAAEARYRDGREGGDCWPARVQEFDFRFIGLLGLDDPLRAEIPAAIQQCRGAGIRVIMITGDYPATAYTIATKAGLATQNLATEDLLTGAELAALDDAALRERLKNVNVCARITPEQKLRIVQALKANGDIVAMTGDGVNDAPALKAAHVGVAMGGRGTDVAREASSLVLLDDNFASIVRAVTLGRRIFDNLQKSMTYILAVHVPIAGMALLTVLSGLPVMLYPMHMAFLELIIDPACSVAFENEPAEADIMRRPPRNTRARLFGSNMMIVSLLQGAGVLLVVLGAYAGALGRLPEAQARAFAFAVLVLANLVLIFFNRSRTRSLANALRTLNAGVVFVSIFTLAMLALMLYVPFAASIFQFAPLSAAQWALAIALGFASVAWAPLLGATKIVGGQPID